MLLTETRIERLEINEYFRSQSPFPGFLFGENSRKNDQTNQEMVSQRIVEGLLRDFPLENEEGDSKVHTQGDNNKYHRCNEEIPNKKKVES